MQPSKTKAQIAAQEASKIIASAPRRFVLLDQITREGDPTFPGFEDSWNDCGQGAVKFPGGAITLEWWEGGWHGKRDKPDLDLVAKSFRAYPQKSKVSIDIEGDHVHDLRFASRKVVDRSIKLKRDVIETAKKARPDLEIGLYAAMPSDYWNACYHALCLEADQKRIDGKPLNSTDVWLISKLPAMRVAIEEWQAACEYSRSLLSACDFVELDCYARYNAKDGANDPNDIKSDAMFVRANVAMARKFAGRKPIIPTVSNQIFEPDAEPLLSEARFRAQCEALKAAGVDGVIVWNWTQGQPLTKQQVRCMELVLDVFGKTS